MDSTAESAGWLSGKALLHAGFSPADACFMLTQNLHCKGENLNVPT
jgi:hypothetical protein